MMTTFLTILPASAARMYAGRRFHTSRTAAERRHEVELMEALTACNMAGIRQTQLAHERQVASQYFHPGIFVRLP